MVADAVGPVPAPPSLAALPIGMPTKDMRSLVDDNSMSREAYSALRQQLPIEAGQVRTRLASSISATKNSYTGKPEMNDKARESSSNSISRTGVYFNDAQVTHTLHPLQECSLAGVKVSVPSRFMLGKPLSPPPPLPRMLLPRHLRADDARASCVRGGRGMPTLKPLIRSIPPTPLVKPTLKRRRTQAFYSKPHILKASQRCKHHKIPTKERAGIPKLYRNDRNEFSADQRLFLEAAAKLTASSRLHVIKDECDEDI